MADSTRILLDRVPIFAGLKPEVLDDIHEHGRLGVEHARERGVFSPLGFARGGLALGQEGPGGFHGVGRDDTFEHEGTGPPVVGIEFIGELFPSGFVGGHSDILHGGRGW